MVWLLISSTGDLSIILYAVAQRKNQGARPSINPGSHLGQRGPLITKLRHTPNRPLQNLASIFLNSQFLPFTSVCRTYYRFLSYLQHFPSLFLNVFSTFYISSFLCQIEHLLSLLLNVSSFSSYLCHN
jgi:hypothetical protein